MLDAFIYDFGYPWPLSYGHLLVAIVFGLLGVAGWRYRWRSVITAVAAAVALWGLTGSYIVHHIVRLNRPVDLPTERFLSTGSGRVLDLGAGTGRSALMVLRSRRGATVTALDIYSGHFGIEENTPDHLMANAKVAGVADRIDVKVADMRHIPLGDATYDAVVSVAAIDHLRADDVKTALGEAARVLKPQGELLLMNINVDGWIRTAFPWMHGHGYFGRPQDAPRWRSMIANAGFDIVEEGTRPATLYFLGTKRARIFN
jgi:ubiquinone/menaquinone biosynthesis C-methylase UbiE